MGNPLIAFVIIAFLLLPSCEGPKKGGEQDGEAARSGEVDSSASEYEQLPEDARVADTARRANTERRPEHFLLDLSRLEKPDPLPADRILAADSLRFRIKLPGNWRVQSAPPAGDGYLLSIPSDKADVRIYTENTKGSTGGLAPPQCNQKEPFQFLNQEGTKCRQSRAVYYYITQRSKRLVFYVKAQKAWLQQHQEQLDSIACTLAFDPARSLSQHLTGF